MPALKVLLTGGSGLIGQYLNIELSKKFNVLSTFLQNKNNCSRFPAIRLDIRDKLSVTNIFSDFRPNVVIHTAAISSPMPNDSFSYNDIINVNVEATEVIASLCDKYKSRLIYTSTDLVYDGNQGPMLTEQARINPITLYAETKLLGEEKIKSIFDNFIILRTSLIYGVGLNNSKCHFHEMLKKLRKGESINLFYDQYRTPLSLFDCARIIRELLDLDIKSIIVNFGGKERISRFELGKKLCEIANLDKNLLNSISMSDIPNFPSVADVSMNTTKLQSLGIMQSSIDDSISEIIKQENI